MPDIAALENIHSSFTPQGKIEKPDVSAESVVDDHDPMAHATRLDGRNPADEKDEDQLLKLLKDLPKEKPVSVTPAVVEKKAKKPILSFFKKKDQSEQPTKATVNQSQGILMPLINWVNGVGNAVWKFATSLIPMKQTGTGTA